MTFLGVAQDFDGPQPFLLTDFGRALHWKGMANGKNEDEPKNSDWAALFKKVMGFEFDTDDDVIDDKSLGEAGTLVLKSKSYDYIYMGQGITGSILIYRKEDQFVFVDVSLGRKTKQVKSSAKKKAEVPSSSDFEKFCQAPPKKSKPLNSIAFQSSWGVLMASSASFQNSLKVANKKILKNAKALKNTVYQIDDDLGGELVIFRIKAGKYDVYIEDKVNKHWGLAQRIILKPSVGENNGKANFKKSKK